ncbi:MAG TPA: iron-containing alcohol dehydrogenase [Rubrobacteraceae bacterium]|nr:iron-containing alcohol dehydrogenase [Rubrobacteraceae bacterium]
MSRIEIGADTLSLLPEVVSELARAGHEAPPRVVLVTDATPMRRGEGDPKAEAERLLAGRFEVSRVVLGEGRGRLHADEEALSEARAAVAGADCVVVVGSGTVTDVCKEATVDGPPLVVVQTAASVNAFSDDVSVLLKRGTKRTVATRWPDALLVDLATLADAPPAMNLAGFGDIVSMWTAPADWYLASAVGMDDSYHPAPVEMLYKGGRELLDGAAALRRGDPEALDRLARVLTLSGITLGIAGKTAPLSGTEHLVSHLIDMAAEQSRSPVAFHGAQVAVASVPVAAAWQVFLTEFDPSTLDPERLFPEESTSEPLVRDAFATIDPSGGVGEECWNDYAKKLALWRRSRGRVERFFGEWSEHRARMREMVLPPERLAGALREAGASARFGELDPPVAPEVARWALANCHLMRNRFTLADLLFLAGVWDEAFIERILERARSAKGGL